MTQIFHPAQYVFIHTKISEGERITQPTSAGYNDFLVSKWSGVALGEFGLSHSDFSDYPMGLRAEDLADASGEWMAIACQNDVDNSYLVFGDASGFCPIFYSVVPQRGIIVSDSFHGVRRGLVEAGESLSLNINHYIASVTAHHMHFDNPSVQQTMAKEINILKKDEALLVMQGHISKVDRALIGLAGSIDNYETAYQTGIDSITRSLKSMSQSDDLVKTINLSGGVDSRMALAFISAAGLTKNFSINSSDPRSWPNPNTRDTIERDVAIADCIRKNLGMSWAAKGDMDLLNFDFQDSLAFHQGFRSNFSFNFRPKNSHSIANHPHLTLRGGGGEILRVTETGAKIADQISSNFKNMERDLSNETLIKKWYLRRSPTHGQAREIVDSYFDKMEGHFSGDTVEESLNTYYQNTRNRTHFGHLRESATTFNTSVHILANSFFMRAGELLPFEVKKSGKLVKDIFRETDPELLKYQFETESSTNELAAEGYKRISFDYSNWVSDYDANTKFPRTTSPIEHWSANVRGVKTSYDKILAAEWYLNRAFRVVEDLCGSDEIQTIREVHQLLKKKISQNQNHLYAAVAKVASAVDLQFPVINEGNVIHLYCKRSPGSYSGSAITINVQSRSVPKDGWNDKPVVEVSSILSLSKGKIAVKASTSVKPPEGMRFAFHLYKGSTKVEQSWYGENQARIFDAKVEPGKYTVRTYIKSSGDLSPSYGQTSQALVVTDADAVQKS